MKAIAGNRQFRALFISDVHLGTKDCQAEFLLDFLKHNDAETIYLVGDIVDFWRISRSPYWPQSHNDVVQKLLRKVRKGTRIIFIPGNHDEVLRRYCGAQFGGIEIAMNAVHETADGRRILVLHGDEFDTVVRCAKWLAFLGDRAYEMALWTNTRVNWVRRRMGLNYWSLSAYLKLKVKQAVNFIGQFESAVALEAEKHQACGVICGHIHHATMREMNDVLYINTGDWVESCTAVGERYDGQFELIHWLDVVHARQRAEALPVRDLEAAA